MAVAPRMPRQACMPRCLVRSAVGPYQAMTGASTSSPKKQRKKVISNGLTSRAANFTNVAITEKPRQDSSSHSAP
jgi:hypothetical protein